MNFSIRLKDQFKYLYTPILGGVLMDILLIVLFIYFKDISIEKSLILFLFLFLFMSILIFIPLIILYFNHSKVNKGRSLELSKKEDENLFQLKNSTEIHSFSEEDIINVNFFLTAPVYRKSTRWLFWDEFFYYIIRLKNGKSITITCLLCENFNQFVSKDKIIKKKVFFPYIRNG